MQFFHQTMENMGDSGFQAPVRARMSPASDNPALGSLRRVLLSKIEAILNARKLSQVKAYALDLRQGMTGAKSQIQRISREPRLPHHGGW